MLVNDMAMKTPHTSRRYGDQAELRKGYKLRARRLNDSSPVVLGCNGSLTGIIDPHYGQHSHLGQSYGEEIIVAQGTATQESYLAANSSSSATVGAGFYSPRCGCFDALISSSSLEVLS